jgi:FAD linked oxidases, C-terminal domain
MKASAVMLQSQSLSSILKCYPLKGPAPSAATSPPTPEAPPATVKYGGSISAEHGNGVVKRDLLPLVKAPVSLDLM